MIETTITDVNFQYIEVWSPTLNLRWVETNMDLGGVYTKTTKVLQQLWTSYTSGKTEWRDVENVNSEDI